MPTLKRPTLRQTTYGTTTALAVFLAIETAAQVIADGHPDTRVRLAALAISLGAGAVVAHLRRS